MGTPFLHKLGQKIVIFRSFSKIFSELPEIPINVFNIEFYNIFHWKPAKKKIKVVLVLGQNLGQIRSNVLKKVKKPAISLGFFSYFTWGIPFIATDFKFKGCSGQIFARFGSKIAKNCLFSIISR